MINASRYAIPSAVLAAVVRTVYDNDPHALESIGIASWWGASQAWSLVSLVLGLLLATRVNRAMYRFWEGLTLVHKMAGEWYDATSSLIAFSQASKDKQKADEFRHTLVRLVSLMHGSGLHQIKHRGNENFEVLGVNDLDDECTAYLQHCKEFDINRVEVLLHWIQELVNAHIGNVLTTPPPIISRVYQELSRGMVHLNDARKITETPFPFPLAQLVVVLLLFYTLLIPIMVAMFMESAAWSAALTYFCTSCMWTLNMTAGELEQPFGDDENDLPLNELQLKLNRSLLVLLDDRVQRVPSLKAVNVRSAPPRRNFGQEIRKGASSENLEMVMCNRDSASSWLSMNSAPRPTSMKDKFMKGIFGGQRSGSRQDAGDGDQSDRSMVPSTYGFAGVGNDLLTRGSFEVRNSVRSVRSGGSVISHWTSGGEHSEQIDLSAVRFSEEVERRSHNTGCTEIVHVDQHPGRNGRGTPQVSNGAEILNEWLPVAAPPQSSTEKANGEDKRRQAPSLTPGTSEEQTTVDIDRQLADTNESV